MKRETGACIVELRGRYAAALTEDGRFVRIRNRGFEVGQTVRVREGKAQVARRSRAAAFAYMAAGFLLLLMGGFKGYQTPAGVVSLDVNPSIEYTINVFDRVLEIRAVNGDGEAILEQMDESSLRMLSIGDAVEQTIETLRENGYFKQDLENDVVLAASSYTAQHAEQLAQELKTRVSQQRDLTVTSVSVTHEEVEQAHALGASAGKVRIIEQLEQSKKADESFSTEDWLEKPVREIIQKTQEQAEQTQPPAEQNGNAKQKSAPSELPNNTPNPLLPQPSPSASPSVSPDADQRQKAGKTSGEKQNPPQNGSGGKLPRD